MTTTEAKATLPDPTRFRLTINVDGLSPEDQEALGQMVLDSINIRHFYGSVVAFVPEGWDQLSISTSVNLHAPETALAVAMGQCEAGGSPGDSECREIGQIMPEDGEATMPTLSADAAAAFLQLVDEAPEPVVVVRSAAITGWRS